MAKSQSLCLWMLVLVVLAKAWLGILGVWLLTAQMALAKFGLVGGVSVYLAIYVANRAWLGIHLSQSCCRGASCLTAALCFRACGGIYWWAGGVFFLPSSLLLFPGGRDEEAQQEEAPPARPGKKRGTSCAEAQSRRPTSRVIGRRAPEATYMEDPLLVHRRGRKSRQASKLFDPQSDKDSSSKGPDTEAEAEAGSAQAEAKEFAEAQLLAAKRFRRNFPKPSPEVAMASAHPHKHEPLPDPCVSNTLKQALEDMAIEDYMMDYVPSQAGGQAARCTDVDPVSGRRCVEEVSVCCPCCGCALCWQCFSDHCGSPQHCARHNIKIDFVEALPCMETRSWWRWLGVAPRWVTRRAVMAKVAFGLGLKAFWRWFGVVRQGVKYSPAAQRRAGEGTADTRGRRRNVAFRSKKTWTSSALIWPMSPEALADFMIEHQLVHDRRQEQCHLCVQRGEDSFWEVGRRDAQTPRYFCPHPGCNGTREFLEGEEDMFNRSLTVKQNCVLFWIWSYQQHEPSVVEAARQAFVSPDAVRPLFAKWRSLLGDYQERQNAVTRLGGEGVEVEMDEMVFRVTAAPSDGEVVVALEAAGEDEDPANANTADPPTPPAQETDPPVDLPEETLEQLLDRVMEQLETLAAQEPSADTRTAEEREAAAEAQEAEIDAEAREAEADRGRGRGRPRGRGRGKGKAPGEAVGIRRGRGRGRGRGKARGEATGSAGAEAEAVVAGIEGAEAGAGPEAEPKGSGSGKGDSRSQKKVLVMRYLGIFERSSGRYVLKEMADIRVKAGGGGPISNEELWRLLRPSGEGAGDQVLRYGTVIHTDSARAYANLAWKEMAISRDEVRQHNPNETAGAQAEREEAEGQLLGEEDSEAVGRARGWAAPELGRRVGEWSQRYQEFRYAHTAVCHKKKKGRKCQFVAVKFATLFDGRTGWFKGGTELVDGFWARLRKNVSRTSINSRHRQALRQMVWSYQWRDWWGPGVDTFKKAGPAIMEERQRRREAKEAADAERQDNMSLAALQEDLMEAANKANKARQQRRAAIQSRWAKVRARKDEEAKDRAQAEAQAEAEAKAEAEAQVQAQAPQAQASQAKSRSSKRRLGEARVSGTLYTSKKK